MVGFIFKECHSFEAANKAAALGQIWSVFFLVWTALNNQLIELQTAHRSNNQLAQR